MQRISLGWRSNVARFTKEITTELRRLFQRTLRDHQDEMRRNSIYSRALTAAFVEIIGAASRGDLLMALLGAVAAVYAARRARRPESFDRWDL